MTRAAAFDAAPLLLALALATAASSAAEVELRINPRGAPANAFAPSVKPVELLADPEAAATFDEVSGGWTVKVRPLDDFVTELSVALESQDRSLPHPPLKIALPYRDAVAEIILPVAIEGEASDRVRAVYRGPRPGETSTEQLGDFLAAAQVIHFLAAEATPEMIVPTETLARALIVYAEALQKLITGTRWFGVPADISSRRELIVRVIDEARVDKDLASRINLDRLEATFGLIKGAESRLYGRIWAAIVDIPDFQCNEIFPVCRHFYDHLRRMPEEEYEQVRDIAKFQRTQVLLESVRCFRELLSIRPGVRSALPQVVTGPFEGRSPRQIAEDMRAELARELEAVRQENGRAGASCDTGNASATERQLCDALGYILELQPMLVEETANVD